MCAEGVAPIFAGGHSGGTGGIEQTIFGSSAGLAGLAGSTGGRHPFWRGAAGGPVAGGVTGPAPEPGHYDSSSVIVLERLGDW